MAEVFVYSDSSATVREIVGFVKNAGHEPAVICTDSTGVEAVRDCGATKIYWLQGASPLAESYGKCIAGLMRTKNATIFLAGATSRGRDIAAQVAGRLDCGMFSNVTGLRITKDGLEGERIVYGGIICRTETIRGTGVATIPMGLFPAAEAGLAPIEKIAVQADDRLQLAERKNIKREGVDLATAKTVVCVGLGVQNREDLVLAENLAAICGGAVACTRGVAEDRKWFPAEQYIGISGKILKPDLYLGLAVSGQVQHVFGIREAKIIAAVNIDETCSIIKSSDYALIGDWKEITPLLAQALSNA